MTGNRPRRVGEEIKRALSRVMQRDIKDPRIPAIFTITEVVVSNDLRHATVHYSQLPDGDAELDDTEDFLIASRGYLRSLVAREVNLKFCPDLHFRYDASTSNFQSVNNVLQDLRKKGEDLDSPIDES